MIKKIGILICFCSMIASCANTNVSITHTKNKLDSFFGLNLLSVTPEKSNDFRYSKNYHRVKKGDTVYALSRYYEVPIRSMITVNRLKAPYKLNVNQLIKIPPAPYHVIQSGDTLYSISKKYNVDISSLIRINYMKPPYVLKLNHRLKLPGSIVQNIKIAKAKSYSSSKKYVSDKSVYNKKADYKAKKSVYLAKPEKRSSSRFAWPVRGKIISNFGPIGKGRHNDGINIKADHGTSVKAAENGVVAYVGNELKGFGNLILIKHSGGWVTAYAHNHKFFVKKGEKVTIGQKIASVGSTGGVKSAQLHFEIRKGTRAINPLNYMDK